MRGHWHHASRCALLILLFLAFGCEPEEETPVSTQSDIFDRPQAIRFVGDLLVVTNSGYRASEWAPGFISIIDPAQASVVNQIDTSQFNPQVVSQTSDYLAVVNTGTYDRSDFEQPRSDRPGGIDLFKISTLRTAHEPDSNLELAGVLPSPADIEFIDHRALITSTLEAEYLSIERDGERLNITGTHTLFTGSELSLNSVRTWRDTFILVDFNSDTLRLVLNEDTVLCTIHIGRRPEEMEGATAPYVSGDDLYVLLALSGELRRIDLPALRDDCDPVIETVVSPLGQVPNDLFIRDGRAFVVHSGDNHVAEYDLSTGNETQRWVLPVGSNPWAADLSQDGRLLAVTRWADSKVTLIHLETGEMMDVAVSESGIR